MSHLIRTMYAQRTLDNGHPEAEFTSHVHTDPDDPTGEPAVSVRICLASTDQGWRLTCRGIRRDLDAFRIEKTPTLGRDIVDDVSTHGVHDAFHDGLTAVLSRLHATFLVEDILADVIDHQVALVAHDEINRFGS